jgi:hypothetical protein
MKFGMLRRLIPVVGSVALVGGTLGAVLTLGATAPASASSSTFSQSSTTLFADPPIAGVCTAADATATGCTPTTQSTPFTVIAHVTGESGPPTGESVTFTYKNYGGQTVSGTLGTATIDSDGNAQLTNVMLTVPKEPPINGDNQDYYITANYGGDANYPPSTAIIIFSVDAICTQSRWPANTTGFPKVVPGKSPQGYYIGQSNGLWSITTVTGPVRKPVTFEGDVLLEGGRILNVTTTKNERSDTVDVEGNNLLDFKFTTILSLDSVSFYAGCGPTLTMALSTTGKYAGPTTIYLGTKATKMVTSTFTTKRSYP